MNYYIFVCCLSLYRVISSQCAHSILFFLFLIKKNINYFFIYKKHKVIKAFINENKTTLTKHYGIQIEFKIKNVNKKNYIPIDFKKADDLKFVSHWEALQKLFTGTKTMQKKEKIQNVFEIEDLSFQLLIESTPLITEENQKFELTTEDIKFLNRRYKILKLKESFNQMIYTTWSWCQASRINLQQETTTEQQLPLIQWPSEEEIEAQKQFENEKIDLIVIVREAQQQLNKYEELQTQPSNKSLRMQKMSQRSYKINWQNSQHQTRRYYQNNEIEEESEIDQTTDRQRLTEETLSKYDEEQSDIVTPTHTADQTPQYFKYQTPISNLSTAAEVFKHLHLILTCWIYQQMQRTFNQQIQTISERILHQIHMTMIFNVYWIIDINFCEIFVKLFFTFLFNKCNFQIIDKQLLMCNLLMYILQQYIPIIPEKIEYLIFIIYCLNQLIKYNDPVKIPIQIPDNPKKISIKIPDNPRPPKCIRINETVLRISKQQTMKDKNANQALPTPLTNSDKTP